MAFSIDNLTLGEIARVEEVSGQSIASIADSGAPKGKTLAVLVMVAQRRHDKNYTMKDAEQLTMTEALELLGLNPEAEEDPKDEN